MDKIDQVKSDLEYVQLLAPLWNFLSLSETPAQSDVIFVFGCIDMNIPKYAAKLWKAGFAGKILVTGDSGLMKSNEFNCTEAEAFADCIKKTGVPKENIFIESMAKNTGENVRFGMELLVKYNVNPKSLLLVARPFSMQRCVATFHKFYPNIKVTPCPAPGSIIDYVDRPRPEFALRLVAELDRLENYPALGFTAPIFIPATIREAANRIAETFNC